MQEVTVGEFYSPPPTGGHITRTLCNKVTLLQAPGKKNRRPRQYNL